MSEKVLIKSESKTDAWCKAIRQLSIIAAVCVIIGAIIMAIASEIDDQIWNIIVGIVSIWAMGVGGLALLAVIVLGITYLIVNKCEICITDYNVKGKAHFGKEVVLPLDSVSAYSTRKFLSTIAVATPSGLTRFSLIANYKEIGDVLAQKIKERQENVQNNKNIEPTSDNSNNLDDLLKLKSLLDAGVITQGEFDAKKKQLLDI